MLSARISVPMVGPRTATMVSAISRPGNESTTSTTVPITISTFPPKKPAHRPSVVPNDRAERDDERPIMAETLAP